MSKNIVPMQYKSKAITALLLLTFLGICQLSHGLLCADSDDAGEQVMANCTNCPYCVASVDVMEISRKTVSAFSTNSDIEDLAGIDGVFDKAHDPTGMYQVLSVCVLEKYSIGQAEYLFRCYCKRPSCNKAGTLTDYVQKVQVRDMLATGGGD